MHHTPKTNKIEQGPTALMASPASFLALTVSSFLIFFVSALARFAGSTGAAAAAAAAAPSSPPPSLPLPSPSPSAAARMASTCFWASAFSLARLLASCRTTKSPASRHIGTAGTQVGRQAGRPAGRQAGRQALGKRKGGSVGRGTESLGGAGARLLHAPSASSAASRHHWRMFCMCYPRAPVTAWLWGAATYPTCPKHAPVQRETEYGIVSDRLPLPVALRVIRSRPTWPHDQDHTTVGRKRKLPLSPTYASLSSSLCYQPNRNNTYQSDFEPATCRTRLACLLLGVLGRLVGFGRCHPRDVRPASLRRVHATDLLCGERERGGPFASRSRLE